MKLDSFFRFLIFSEALSSLLQFRSMFANVSKRQFISLSYPRLFDLWFCLPVALGLTIMRLLLVPIIKPIAAKLITEVDSDERQFKIERFSVNIITTIYFLGTTIYAYHFLKDANWFPEELGGYGKPLNVWDGYPLQANEEVLRWYFYINGGYQICSLTFLLTDGSMPHFWDMLLQNITAIFLISFSYMANFLRIGSIIMFCHDFCDIFSFACKAFAAAPYKPLTISLFLCLVTSWGYLRLYCFARLCLHAFLIDAFSIVNAAELHGWIWFACLLLTQLLMNIYWFFLMVKMFSTYVVYGKQVDIEHQDVFDYKVVEDKSPVIKQTTSSSLKED